MINGIIIMIIVILGWVYLIVNVVLIEVVDFVVSEVVNYVN